MVAVSMRLSNSDIGGVDEVDSGLQRAVDDTDALLVILGAPVAEHHGPEAQLTDRDAGASQTPLLHCVVLLIRLPASAGRSSRDEPDRRCAGARAGDRVGDALGVPAILAPVSRVDLVVDAMVSVGEGHIALDAPGLDMVFAADLGAAEPGRGGPVDRANVQVAVVRDDPDRPRAAQRAVTPGRGDLQFFCVPDPAELIVRPCGHFLASLP